MKTSALRGWLRKERAREHEAKVAAGEYTAPLPWVGMDFGHEPTNMPGTFSNMAAPPLTAEHLERVIRACEAMAGAPRCRPSHWGYEVRMPPVRLALADGWTEPG